MADKEKTLFIGGPHDGQRIAVVEGLPRIGLPYQKGQAVLAEDTNVKPVGCSYAVYDIQLYMHENQETYVYVHTQIPLRNVFEMLVSGYGEPTAHEKSLLSKLEAMYQTVQGLKKELAASEQEREKMRGALEACYIECDENVGALAGKYCLAARIISIIEALTEKGRDDNGNNGGEVER